MIIIGLPVTTRLILGGNRPVEETLQKIKDAYQNPFINHVHIEWNYYYSSSELLDERIQNAVVDLIVETFDSRTWKGLLFCGNGFQDVKSRFQFEFCKKLDLRDCWLGGNGVTISSGYSELTFENNPIRDEGMSPLHLWSRDGKVEEVSFHLDSGCTNYSQDLNGQSKYFGWTPLHLASMNGHLEVVKILIEKGGCLVNTINNFGNSPIQDAVGEGKADVAQFLWDKGADATLLLAQQPSLLHKSLQKGHSKILELLIRIGMDPNIADDVLGTPLHHAVLRYRDSYGLNKEVDRATIDCARVLLEYGANPNTLLLEACEGNKDNRVEMVKLLLEFNADVAASRSDDDDDDDDGWTPLHFACEGKDYGYGGINDELVHLLVEAGAQVNAIDSKSMTPLHHIAARGYRNGSRKVVQYLLEHGADPCARDKDGRTPLHLAARCQNDDDDDYFDYFKKEGNNNDAIKVVQCLLENGSDPHVEDKDGKTPLHLAAANGGNDDSILEVVECLLRHGADPKAQEAYSNT